MTDEFSSADEQSAIDDGSTPLALALGLAAALAAGGMWAALVYVTNMEIGYAAWGVGLLVGLAMTRVTAQRTQKLAYAAALFAMVGLIAGKAFIFAASSGRIAEEFSADEEMMKGAVAWQMYAQRTLDQGTLDEVDRTEAASDTLSDAAWSSMLQQAETKLATMTDEEKQAVADETARGLIQSMGIVGGVQAQLSMFDLLWVFLAVGSAYRMLAPGSQPEPAEIEPTSV